MGLQYNFDRKMQIVNSTLNISEPITREWLASKLSEVYNQEILVSNFYKCKDLRIRVDYGPKNKIKTCQLARALLEIKLGRPLAPNETVDHIDDDKTNDSLDNLQVLSLQENVRKSSRGFPENLGRKQPIEERKRGEKNGMAKLTNSAVLEYRELYWSGAITKKELHRIINVNCKSMLHMLKGKTYVDAGGPTGPSIRGCGGMVDTLGLELSA